MFQKNLLQGKNVFITGGGTGLGLAMAKRITELGGQCIIVSRKEEHLNQAKNILTEIGNAPWTHTCDVRDEKMVQSVVDKALEDLGHIDVLINNAAGNFLCPSEELTPKGFKIIIDIVLNGSFNCTLSIGRHMIERKNGVILNILAPYIFTGSPYVLPSACAKAGVAAMTRTLAVEWGKYGVRVNGIAPGPFPTEGAWSRLIPEKGVEEKMIERIPLHRVGNPEELADLVVFLISDFSSYINGEIIFIDGGQWLRQGAMFADLEGYEEWMRRLRPRKKFKTQENA